MLHHRRDVVLLIRLHRRQFEIGAFGNGAGLRHFSGDTRDATNLVFGNDGARRKAPHATVYDPHAKSTCLSIGIGWNANTTDAASTTATTAAAPATATSAATKSARASCTSASGAEVGSATGQRRVHGEAHVGVRATGELRFAQDDVREPLELRFHNSAFRRVGADLTNQITRVQRERGTRAKLLEKIATRRAHGIGLSKVGC